MTTAARRAAAVKKIKEETNYSVGFKWILRSMRNLLYHRIDLTLLGDWSVESLEPAKIAQRTAKSVYVNHFFRNIFHIFCLRSNLKSDFLQKNNDSVKEAPAYCRSFLDGLYKTNEGGDGAKPLL